MKEPWKQFTNEQVCSTGSEVMTEYFIDEGVVENAVKACAIHCIDTLDCSYAHLNARNRPYNCKLYKKCIGLENTAEMHQWLFKKG